MKKKILKPKAPLNHFKHTFETVVATYSLFDKNGKFYLSSWSNSGYQKIVMLMSVIINGEASNIVDDPYDDEGDDEMNDERYFSIYQMGFGVAESAFSVIQEVAPVDIRVYLDSVEIVDNEKKSELLHSLALYQVRVETNTLLRRMTPALKNSAVQATELRNKLQTSINNGFFDKLDASKLKKLQASFNELI